MFRHLVERTRPSWLVVEVNVREDLAVGDFHGSQLLYWQERNTDFNVACILLHNIIKLCLADIC